MKPLLRLAYRSLSSFLQNRHIHLVKSLTYLQRPRLIPLNRIDYVRLSALELAAYEVKKRNVPGSVAELGVYKGDFAEDINRAFPDRDFYLFDTFTGFDERDKQTDKHKGYSTTRQDFSDTSAESVLRRMPHAQKCIIRKGFFPETADGINGPFAFVSLDTDLYEPIYNGLCFFYPKLSAGGYIFIHDFNNEEYKGAREAVLLFCQENNIGYVPIADDGGSVIITK